jgi:hypothetical protein
VNGRSNERGLPGWSHGADILEQTPVELDLVQQGGRVPMGTFVPPVEQQLPSRPGREVPPGRGVLAEFVVASLHGRRRRASGRKSRQVGGVPDPARGKQRRPGEYMPGVADLDKRPGTCRILLLHSYHGRREPRMKMGPVGRSCKSRDAGPNFYVLSIYCFRKENVTKERLGSNPGLISMPRR